MLKFETETYKRLKNKPQDNFPKSIIIHHSGGTDANPLLDTSHHTAKTMESWHLQKGWEGLGYNYVIHKDGAIWRGRPEHYHGGHAGKENRRSIGICLSGNFDATMPTQEQIEAIKWLLEDILGRHPNLTKDDIVPHRKFANKSCPGKNLSDTWARDLLKQDDCAKIRKELRSQKLFNQALLKIIKNFYVSKNKNKKKGG